MRTIDLALGKRRLELHLWEHNLKKIYLSLLTIAHAGIVAAFGITLFCVFEAAAQTPSPISVPFVGCAADGQVGPIAPPKIPQTIPTAPPAAAQQLAYYASTHLGVFGPRGWHCFELYGSSGSTLIVTPERHNASDFLRSDGKLKGPAVQLSRSSGGTSGRVEVARVAARIFPAFGSFVQQVIDEGMMPKTEFPTGPYPTDTLTRRSDTEVEFLTAANREGLGTNSRIAKNGQAIRGVAILLPEDDMDLVMLATRLPPELLALAPVIVQMVERDLGTPQT